MSTRTLIPWYVHQNVHTVVYPSERWYCGMSTRTFIQWYIHQNVDTVVCPPERWYHDMVTTTLIPWYFHHSVDTVVCPPECREEVVTKEAAKSAIIDLAVNTPTGIKFLLEVIFQFLLLKTCCELKVALKKAMPRSNHKIQTAPCLFRKCYQKKPQSTTIV